MVQNSKHYPSFWILSSRIHFLNGDTGCRTPSVCQDRIFKVSVKKLLPLCAWQEHQDPLDHRHPLPFLAGWATQAQLVNKQTPIEWHFTEKTLTSKSEIAKAAWARTYIFISQSSSRAGGRLHTLTCERAHGLRGHRLTYELLLQSTLPLHWAVTSKKQDLLSVKTRFMLLLSKRQIFCVLFPPRRLRG